MLDFIAGWAYKHKVAFHKGQKKNVVLCSNCHDLGPPIDGQSGLFFPTVGCSPTQLTWTRQQKWLGILWDACLVFTAALTQKIACGGAMVADLAGLVLSRTIPLALGLELFESKVEGFMRFGRWLLVLCPNAESLLNAAYESWARALAGSPHWRSGVIAAGELGWLINGFGRGVLDVAKRRAKYWNLEDSDFHKILFVSSQTCSTSWAYRSLALLSSLELADWPDWVYPGGSLSGYSNYIRAALEQRSAVAWHRAATRHRGLVPYRKLMNGELRAPHMALTMGLPWGVLLMQLSQVKLRCATVSLGHLSGRRSAARSLQCIGCDRWVSNSCVHVFGDCPRWEAVRAKVIVSLQLPVGCRTWDITYSVLGCAPGSAAFACCLEFMEDVVRHAEAYRYKS